MHAAGKRKVKPKGRFPVEVGYETLDDAWDEAQQVSSKHRRGRAQPPAANSGSAAELTEDLDDDDLLNVSPEDDGDVSSGGCEEEGEDVEEDAAAATAGVEDLCRPLDPKHLGRLAKEARNVLGPRTRNNYDDIIRVLERWLAAGGYLGGKARKGQPYQLDFKRMTDTQLINLFTRFFEWYVKEGRPGDPNKGGKEVQGGQYGRSAAMKVHSALQEHLNNGRGAVGRSGFQLANVMPYRSLYVQYCSKKRDKAQCEAADDDCEYRAAVVHMSFGRDPYVQGAHAMLASKDPLQAKLLSMYLGQVQMVARGDDMRGRRLKDLGTRTLSCVGPSTAVALTILQPPAGGKALKTRPAYKGMLRAKLPELCGIGALFRWLSLRFTKLAEAIPRPGTRQFKRFFLWPGRNGGKVSYTHHANLMQQLFDELGVDTTKLTHELRIFAAQLLYEMGVSLEVIQRIGHWLLDAFGTAYIVPGFTAEALLALAFWAGAAQKDFTAYWAERFHVAVPEDLIELLMPGLATMERENVQAAADGKPPSKAATHLATVLRMGATVVVQDALVLAAKFPDNPVHDMLLQTASFKELRQDFETYKALGGFRSQEPLSFRQVIQRQTQQLQDHMVRTFKAAFGWNAPPLTHPIQLDWTALQQQMQEAAALEEQTRAFQQQPTDAAAALEELRRMAAGSAKPSKQMLKQVRQQQDVWVQRNSSLSLRVTVTLPLRMRAGLTQHV